MALSSKLSSAIQKLAKSFETNPGGLADGMSPEDFPQDQLAKGIKVENKEHGLERGIATTMDHLVENEEYYDYLEGMEKQMNKQAQIEGRRPFSEDPFSGTGGQRPNQQLGGAAVQNLDKKVESLKDKILEESEKRKGSQDYYLFRKLAQELDSFQLMIRNFSKLKVASAIQKLASVLIRRADKVEDIQRWIDKYSVENPSAREYENGHIYVLFADGELDITKAGSLFGQRNLNMQRRPSENKAPEGLKWPSMYESHPCVYIEDGNAANALQSAIFEPPAVGSIEYNREEALNKMFGEEKKPRAKEIVAEDVALATGFVPQDVDGMVFAKEGASLHFAWGKLQFIEVDGKKRDFGWNGRFNKTGIWLHPTGFYFNDDKYWTPETRKLGKRTIGKEEEYEHEAFERWKHKVDLAVGSNSNFCSNASDETFIELGFKKL